MSVAFFSDSEASISSKVDVKSVTKTSEEQIDNVYEVQKCVQWITDGNHQRVAVQFPDELMCDAVAVTTRLQALVGPNTTVFILGDTSYGSCCVDEVAAQHYNSDAIIHIGRSCLSQTCSMPVLFVFGRSPLDVQHCVDQFCMLFPDPEARVLIMYDTVYSYASGEIMSRIPGSYTNVILSQLEVMADTGNGEQISDSQCSTSRKKITKCGRSVIIGSNEELSDFSVFYIGSESLTMNNLMYNFQCSFCSYNPVCQLGRKENIGINKLLMKRYYMVEKAKDAKIVGILIGTLGVANYREMLERQQSLIKKAGKKSYVFIVGKVNVAKLANFMEIEVFVLIACAENSLLDCSEFYQPVITPYEMELACNLDREWTGQYPTDFSQLLPGGSDYVPIPEEVRNEDETDVSLVTGKIRYMNVRGNEPETGRSVVLRSDAMTVATQAETAGEYLEMRSWQGLQQNLGETPVTKAVQGLTGIAMGYSNEPVT